MEFKHNYFLRNMVDLDIKSLAEYLKHSDVNYVIMVNDEPIVFAGDKTPAVFGGEIDVQNELAECELVNENFELKEGVKVLTESDFIKQFCIDAIEEAIIDLVKKKGDFDNNYYLFYFSNALCGSIDIRGMKDVVTAFARGNQIKGKELEILIANDDDTKQEYVSVNELGMETIIKMIAEIESKW